MTAVVEGRDENPGGLVAVRFLLAHRCYGAGEVAGFRPSLADRLVEAGIAVRNEPAGSPRKDAKAPPLGRTDRMVRRAGAAVK